MRRVISIALLALVLLGIAPVARGQEMEVRFYLMPIIHLANGCRWPKYIYRGYWNPDGLQLQWAMKGYGNIDLGCVAVNAETVDHDTLGDYPDVYQFPANLGVNVPQADVSVLQAYLETNGVPGDWTSPSQTWLETLKTIIGMFLFMQRLTAEAGESPLDWGYTLNTQWRNMEPGHQQAILDAAATRPYYDTSFIGDNTLVRAIIREISAAWLVMPIHFGFVTL